MNKEIENKGYGRATFVSLVAAVALYQFQLDAAFIFFIILSFIFFMLKLREISKKYGID